MNKKTVQRRIRSVRNTRKITKAMELVAGAKMRKATDAVLASRPYVEALRGVVGSIAKQADVSLHPLLRKSKDRERVLVILMMSDRGLCGGYNVQMSRQMRQFLTRHAEGATVDVITIGKRAAHAARQLKLNVLEHYAELGADPKVESLRPIVRSIITGYTDGTFDDVFIGYTDFQSAIRQIPVVATFLPLSKMHEGFGSVGAHLYDESARAQSGASEAAREYVFEPSVKQILDQALMRIIESMTYQALLEAVASEHAARMMAMRNATEAAGEMIDTLTLIYNKARQAGITQEIAEISGGAAALEG